MRRIAAACWASFCPKTATSGCTTWKSLATIVRTPSKWPGRCAPSKSSVIPRTVTVVRSGSGIHGPSVGREDDRGAPVRDQPHVPLEVARIAVEILVRPELRRVDEHGHDHDVGALPRQVDEREVPLVEGAHRRDERDPPTRPQPRDRASAFLDRGGDQDAQGYDSSSPGNVPSLTSVAKRRSPSRTIRSRSA